MEGRGGAGIAVDPKGPALVVLGGFAGREMKDVHRFDIVKGVWSKLDIELEEACSVAVTAEVGGRIVLFGGEVEPSAKGHAGAGGFSGNLSIFSGEMEKLGEVSCNEGERQQLARGWSSGDRWGQDKLVVVGGLTGDDSNPTRLDDVWCATIR